MPIAVPSLTFDRWSVVSVPFPYTDGDRAQRRPAVVVSGDVTGRGHGFYWVVMVTSAENARWPDDVPIGNLEAAGLAFPSVVRSAKIATIQHDRIDRVLGTLGAHERRLVKAAIRRILG